MVRYSCQCYIQCRGKQSVWQLENCQKNISAYQFEICFLVFLNDLSGLYENYIWMKWNSKLDQDV